MKNTLRTQLKKHLPALLLKSIRTLKKKLRLRLRGFHYGMNSFSKDIIIDDLTFKIIIDPYHNGCIDIIVADTGSWEKNMSGVIFKNLNQNGVFIDIGANIGYHTLTAAAHLKNTGAIYSIEPIRRLATQIENSARLNDYKNITVLNTALGDKPGRLPLFVRSENIGGSSLSPYNEFTICESDSTEEVDIKILDDILPEGIKVDLIKIDTEGFEFEALVGAKNILSKYHPTIIIEFSPLFYESDRRGKTEEFISYLSSLTYTYQLLDGTPLDPIKWMHDKIDSQVDIVASANI